MIATFLIKQASGRTDVDSSTTMRHHVKEFTREELETLDSKYLVLFLKSLARTNPAEKIHLKLYNFSEEERCSFQGLNQNLTIESHELKVYDDFEKSRQLLWADLAIEQLQKHDKVILMDVDLLIRGDMQKMYSALDEHDVAVQTWKTCGTLCDYDTSTNYGSIYMSGKEISTDAIKICSGVMGLKGSKALQIFKEVRDLIDSSEPDWLSGQLHLYSLYKKYTENNLASFYELPQELHDMQLIDSSVIWHGSVKNKQWCYEHSKADFEKNANMKE